MTQTILHKRSNTPGKVPTTTQLSLGEISLNTYDGKLFFKKNNGADAIVELGQQTFVGDVTGSGNGNVTLTISNSGVTAGTYTKVTVNSKGQVTTGTSLISSDVTGALGFIPANKAGDTLTGFLTLHADPTSALHAVSKQYVDNAIAGLDVKSSVKAASTTNVSLSAPGAVIDGVSLTAGDRILLKNQTALSENGIYIWSSSGAALVRSSDMNSWTEIPSAFVFVEQGVSNADTGWVCVADQGGTLESSSINWSQFSGAGAVTAGVGISVVGNQINLAALTDSGTGSFLKLTRDTYGRISGTTAVTASDVSGLSGLLSSTTPSAPTTSGSAGTGTSVARADHNHPFQSISCTGDATGSGTTSIALTLANSGVTAGTYTKVTVNAKGIITAGSNPTTLAGYGIVDAYTMTYIDSMTIDGGSF